MPNHFNVREKLEVCLNNNEPLLTPPIRRASSPTRGGTFC